MENMPGMTYSTPKIGDQYVCGMMTFPPETAEQNIPPHWGAYITVDNADESARKCTELGGEVVYGPADIPKIGRFAVIRDPQGAFVQIITYFPEAGA